MNKQPFVINNSLFVCALLIGLLISNIFIFYLAEFVLYPLLNWMNGSNGMMIFPLFLCAGSFILFWWVENVLPMLSRFGKRIFSWAQHSVFTFYTAWVLVVGDAAWNAWWFLDLPRHYRFDGLLYALAATVLALSVLWLFLPQKKPQTKKGEKCANGKLSYIEEAGA